MQPNLKPLSLSLLIGLAAICSIVMSSGAAAELAPTDQTTEESTQTPENASNLDADPQPALQSGRLVFVDPQTRRPTALPSPAQRAAGRAHLQSMINRSTAGLIETASPTSGVMVNLQGRFRHATGLSLDAEGQVVSQCTATPPAESDEETANE